MTRLPKIKSQWDAISALDLEDLDDAANDTREAMSAFTALAGLASRLDDLAENYRRIDDQESAEIIEKKALRLWRAVQKTPVEKLNMPISKAFYSALTSPLSPIARQ